MSEAEHKGEEDAAAALSDREKRQRLEEAQVQGQVRHPHEVRNQAGALERHDGEEGGEGG